MKKKNSRLFWQDGRIFKATFIAFFSLLFFGLTGEAQVNTDQSRYIDSLFSNWKSDSTPGLELLVLRKGRKILDRSYGLADISKGIPNNSGRKFWVASMSKQFTGLAVAMLVVQKKISLDDDIRKWLPEIPWLGDTIRIKHLVYHTSGLRDGFTLTAMRFKPEEEYTNANVLESLSRQTGRNFRPGERFEYNNSGYVLLALIVERSSKKSFPDFVKENIFRPLGMNDSRFVSTFPQNDSSVATGYAVSEENNKLNYQPAYFKGQTYGSSGLITTVTDLAKWDRIFYKPAFGKAVQELQIRKGKLNNGQSIPYAFGLEIVEFKNKKAISHSGADAGYKSEMIRFPSEEFTVICLANTENAYGLTNSLLHIADLFISFKQMVSGKIYPDCNPKSGAYIDSVSLSSMRFLQMDSNVRIASAENGFYQLLQAEANCFYRKKEDLTETYQINRNKITEQGWAESAQYQHINPKSSDTMDLKSAAGAWYSPELETTYHFFEKDGMFWLKFFEAYDVPFTAYEGNLFAAEFLGTNIVHLVKDQSGRVVELEFNRPGIHKLKFIRQ